MLAFKKRKKKFGESNRKLIKRYYKKTVVERAVGKKYLARDIFEKNHFNSGENTSHVTIKEWMKKITFDSFNTIQINNFQG